MLFSAVMFFLGFFLICQSEIKQELAHWFRPSDCCILEKQILTPTSSEL
ncbi:hypothetical protein GLYMA_05G229751v4 [Glycine max]|nr:hypothetical protein GYH30_013543 [Glycine max]KRH60268.2 hypothetical protein GLYMA_05G229751v4 [Glycine max]